MRKCTDGYGNDSTSACHTYLMNSPNPMIRHLYMIGELGNPNTLYLTDNESPLYYAPWGTFYPAAVRKGAITTKVGLEVQKTTVTYSPGNLGVSTIFTSRVSTANPVQLARIHFYDNWPVRIFKVFTPTSGDAMTLGGCVYFGGRVSDAAVSREGVTFNVNSYMDIMQQKTPPNVIESTSTLAAYTGASLVAGETSQPTFIVVAGSTSTFIIADCLSPTANKIYGGNVFLGGFLVFLSGTGATLPGVWSAIGNNGETTVSGVNHSNFAIFSPLPWAPTPGVDKFYVSPAAPINIADGDYYGFPYVPAPTTAV